MSYTEELFVVAIVWTLAAIAIAYFIRVWWLRGAFVVLAVGIPFWELPYGYFNFRKLCTEESTLQLFERIAPQQSVCIEYFDQNLYSSLESAGFTLIEVTERSDSSKREIASGRVVLTTPADAKSAYCIVFKSNISRPWRILRADTLIVHPRDYKVVGRQSRFRWDGMWWQEKARPLLGIGGECPVDFNVPIRTLRHGTG